MKQCLDCSQELKDEAKFCHKCGTKQAPIEEGHYAPREEVVQAVQPTKFEKEVAKVAQNIKKINTDDVKQQARQYHQYFMDTLKTPGKRSENIPSYYGVINVAVYALSWSIFIWGTSSIVTSAILSYIYSSDLYSSIDALNPFMNDLTLSTGLVIAVLLFSIGFILYVTQRYIMHRNVSYLYVLERFSNHFALATIFLVVAGIMAKIGFSFLLIRLSLVLALGMSSFTGVAAPILTLSTEWRKGGREIPLLYAVVIYNVLLFVLFYIVTKLLG